MLGLYQSLVLTLPYQDKFYILYFTLLYFSSFYFISNLTYNLVEFSKTSILGLAVREIPGYHVSQVRITVVADVLGLVGVGRHTPPSLSRAGICCRVAFKGLKLKL